jgi:hypothetical protein
MTPEDLIAAFALPAGPPPRRVPKASLSDHAPTAADRRLIDKALARLDWIAGLNMGSIGVPAGEVDGLTIDTINMLFATTRGPMPSRLAEIIHRAIPKPVILIHADEDGDAASLSLAPKRAAERETGRVVTIEVYDSGALSQAEAEFAATLALSRLPTRDLAALYGGLIERVEALEAARTVGRVFRLATSVNEAAEWREALKRQSELNNSLAAQISLTKRETQLARRVELGEKAARIRKEIDAVTQRLI